MRVCAIVQCACALCVTIFNPKIRIGQLFIYWHNPSFYIKNNSSKWKIKSIICLGFYFILSPQIEQTWFWFWAGQILKGALHSQLLKIKEGIPPIVQDLKGKGGQCKYSTYTVITYIYLKWLMSGVCASLTVLVANLEVSRNVWFSFWIFFVKKTEIKHRETFL